MKEYWPARPAPRTDPETIERYADLLGDDADPGSVAQAWSDAGFDDETATRWLDARCFDPEAAQALAEMGVIPEQAAKRTRDGGGYIDSIAYKVAKGDLTPRQGAARCLSSR